MNETKIDKVKNLKPKYIKSHVLIQAYLQSIPVEHPKVLADQNYILKLVPRVLTHIIELCLESSPFCKLIGRRVIKFSQLFFQVSVLVET